MTKNVFSASLNKIFPSFLLQGFGEEEDSVEQGGRAEPRVEGPFSHLVLGMVSCTRPKQKIRGRLIYTIDTV